MSIKIIAQNKKARFHYNILEIFEAGLCLKGTEVKSLREHDCHLKEAYVTFINGEAYLQKAYIHPYEKASAEQNHEPEGLRKLLLHREELNKIYGKMKEKGFSCVPLKIYFKRALVKVELGLGKGKKQDDKREKIKKREIDREMGHRLKKSKTYSSRKFKLFSSSTL